MSLLNWLLETGNDQKNKGRTPLPEACGPSLTLNGSYAAAAGTARAVSNTFTAFCMSSIVLMEIRQWLFS
jgi:hypothetical protein